MTFALFSNLLMILLCVGVIIQANRMMRQLQAVKNSELAAVVTGLDKATRHAADVLADLKRTLGTDGAALAQNVSDGNELREELSMLIGIANAMAERLVEASEQRPHDTIDHAAMHRPISPAQADAPEWGGAESGRLTTKMLPTDEEFWIDPDASLLRPSGPGALVREFN